MSFALCELTCRLSEEEKYYLDTNKVLARFPMCGVNEVNEEITLSVIVPAYNEERRLGPMMEDCLNYLKTRNNLNRNFTYEIIIVNDGR